MARRKRPATGGIGRMTYRPPADDGLVPQTLAFLAARLPEWRDDPNRPNDNSENSLNHSLCLFLERRVRLDPAMAMIQFLHQSPQGCGRSADIGVHGTEEATAGGFQSYSPYEPFLVVECKRLPSDRKGREREYVTGEKPSGSATGGIQRFKLGLHGAGVETAAMVGYIQQHDATHWHDKLNGWIGELVEANSPDCPWEPTDRLGDLVTDAATKLSRCDSSHRRTDVGVSSTIALSHFWLQMNIE